MKRTLTLMTVLAALAVASMALATIQPGETRTVVGKVSSVDVQYDALVVEVPIEDGMLTVGVTMKEGAPITRRGLSVGLVGLVPGEKVSLTYTLEGGRLMGLKVETR